MEKFSQCGQDLILNKYFPDLYNGFFIDIGCGHPIEINNTYGLEKNYNWNGISLDIEEYTEGGVTWENSRNSKFIKGDARLFDYKKLFHENKVPYEVDYLTMDLEPPYLTLQILYMIPFDEYIFKFITYETDENREGGELRRSESREYLKSKGYVLLGNLGGQDDIYLHESYSNLSHEKNFCDVCRDIGIPLHTIKQFNSECYGN